MSAHTRVGAGKRKRSQDADDGGGGELRGKRALRPPTETLFRFAERDVPRPDRRAVRIVGRRAADALRCVSPVLAACASERSSPVAAPPTTSAASDHGGWTTPDDDRDRIPVCPAPRSPLQVPSVSRLSEWSPVASTSRRTPWPAVVWSESRQTAWPPTVMPSTPVYEPSSSPDDDPQDRSHAAADPASWSPVPSTSSWRSPVQEYERVVTAADYGSWSSDDYSDD